jgi:hypothetical protein
MLARAARTVRVFQKERAPFDIARRDEVRALGDNARVEFSALLDIRLNEEFPAWLEQACHFREECIAHDEAFCVALFPPRIRKMQKHACYAARWTKARERKPSVLAKHPGVRTEASFRKSLIADSRPLATDLEAYKQRFRGRLCPLEQKPRFGSRADLELEMLPLAERPKINALCIRQTRRMRIRIGATPSRTFAHKCRGFRQVFRAHVAPD